MEHYIQTGDSSDDELSIGDIVDILKSHLVLLFVLPLFLSLSSFFYSKSLPPVYSSSSKVLVLLSDFSLDTQSVDLRPEPLDLDTYKEIALSKNILARIYNVPLESVQLQELRDRFSVKYSEGKRSGILFLTVESNDPKSAAREANAWANALVAWERERSLGTLLDEKKSLHAQLKAVDHQLSSLDPVLDADRYASLALLKTSLQRKIDQLDVLEAGIKVRLHILEPAQPPIKPVKPRPMLNGILAGLFGMVLAIFIAFLLESISIRIRSGEEAAAITGLPVLAEFPRITNKNGSLLPKETALFLKTSLTPLLMGEDTNVIIITSTVEGEGKTSIALALALSYAHEGKSTLLVDGDLRKPEVKNRLSLPVQVPGLKEAMEGTDFSPVNVANNLDVLPCMSPPADANDFISRHFKAWIKHLAESRRYGYIIIDTAPILPVPDTLIMAPHASGLLLVAAERRTSKKALRTSIDVLAHLGVRPYGLVMNFVKNPSTIFLGGYENYHYGEKAYSHRPL